MVLPHSLQINNLFASLHYFVTGSRYNPGWNEPLKDQGVWPLFCVDGI